MSRTEIISTSCKCPCGAGTVETRIASTDYVFPSTEVSYEFQCNACVKVWRLANGRLVHKESEKPRIEASKACQEAHKAVRLCALQVAKLHCGQQSFATKKSEFEHLTSIGRFEKGYATYLKWRREGKAMHEILVHEGPSSRGEVLQWAISASGSFGLSGQLGEALDLLSRRKADLAEAEKQIVSRCL